MQASGGYSTMKLSDLDTNDWRLYAKYSQLGLEMVGPLVLGLGLDYALNSMPWLTVAGAVAGLVYGFWRMSKLVDAEENRRPKAKPREPTTK